MPVVCGLRHLARLHADRRDWRSAGDIAAEHDVTEHWVCGMSHLAQGQVFSASGDLPGA